ncbi:uncharacterized protein LOC132733297 [Ruditapes philippinarum]|uniref:uncharacterized protein LOC132733297 n=1 Tax=Ruditapes philippinarum TaxID=129788 RepID=UPI00295A78AA|nr:uncharacterized protein LOC132733297 [Ruditapes philippinarum]
MNPKLLIILLACLWYVDGCDRTCHGGSHNCNNKQKREMETSTNIQLVGSKYTVKLPENPCHFNTYDADHDGKISEGELFGVLGIDKIPVSVLKDLDVVTDHGVITKEAFDAKVSQVIPQCGRSD